MAKWLLWSFIWTIGKLPFDLRSKIGSCIGLLFSFVPTRDRLVTLLQIKHFLKTNHEKKIMRRVYAHFGSTLFECLNLQALIKNPDSFIDFPSWSEAQRLLEQKKGIIALTAHVGNFDAMGAFFANKNVALLAVAKQSRNPTLHFVLARLRESFGFTTLWRANKQGVAQILTSLKSGQVVAALIDQDTRVSSIPIPFFGIPASTPSTIIEIGKKVDAIFASAFVIKNKTGRFEIRVKEISNNLSTEDLLLEYNRRLEEIIREFPEQWAWMHKRWRTTASGERLGGKNYLKYLTELTN